MTESNLKPTKTIYQCFIDADPIAYKGACSVEKVNYQYINKTTKEESVVFASAEDAKTWYQEQVEMLEKDMKDWERLSIPVLGTLKDALSNTEEVMRDYLKTFDKVRNKANPVIKGWLTASKAVKFKDIEGLENRYQFNRFEPESVKDRTWIPKPKPTYLTECREHILKVFPFVRTAPKGFEADSLVIYNAEKAGETGVMLSIDKDISQGENTYYINMNPVINDRELLWCDRIGEIIIKDKVGTNKKDYKGTGFKWLMFQTLCGDPTDGYSGLKGVGAVATLKLLEGLNTKSEIIEAILLKYEEVIEKEYTKKLKSYNNKIDSMEETDNIVEELLPTEEEIANKEIGSKNLFTYLDWSGNIQQRTAEELFSQHCQCAYQERKDLLDNPVKRYFVYKRTKALKEATKN